MSFALVVKETITAEPVARLGPSCFECS